MYLFRIAKFVFVLTCYADVDCRSVFFNCNFNILEKQLLHIHARVLVI